MMTSPQVLFDFQPEANLKNWYIVNDGVMGGVSRSQFQIDEAGNGVFEGSVSLDYNGGFASVRYQTGAVDVSNYSTLVLKVRGGQKRYQARVKTSPYERFSYIAYFEAQEDWTEVRIPLSDMYPSFRGRRLRMDNFPGEQIGEFAILIGNKKEEEFRLEIDWIGLE